MKTFSLRQHAAWLLLAVGVVSALGCQADDARFRLNMAFKKKMEMQNMPSEGNTPLQLPRAVTQDVADLLQAMFGTPDAPRMPAVEGVEMGKLVDIKRLQIAAGPVSSEQTGLAHGLYREHCVHCHGITGDGAGPTAAFLNPYPRDYRMGIYKFKSTKKGDKPTHEDLQRILKNGIPGTAMPSFALLSESELEALIDYVKYLSVRGEVERKLFEFATQMEDPYDSLYGDYTTASEELDTLTKAGVSGLSEASSRVSKAYYALRKTRSSTKEYAAPAAAAEAEKLTVEESQQRIGELKTKLDELEKGIAAYQPPRMFVTINADGKPKTEAEIKPQLEEYLGFAKEIMENWLNSKSIAVAEPAKPLDPKDAASLARGKALFYGPIANCVSCHGESALGDGQRDFYDDWSGEWVEKNKPANVTATYVRLGALPPRKLVPRNLRLGVYRGGRRPVDLYWRITSGIEGAQMPAAPMLTDSDPPDAKKLSQEQVWDLINYVRSLPYESISRPTHDEMLLIEKNL